MTSIIVETASEPGPMAESVRKTPDRRESGQREGHLRSAGLAFGHRQRGARLVHGGLVIARIDAYQHIPGFDLAVIVHQHLRHAAGNSCGAGDDVSVHLRVIRGDAIARR